MESDWDVPSSDRPHRSNHSMDVIVVYNEIVHVSRFCVVRAVYELAQNVRSRVGGEGATTQRNKTVDGSMNLFVSHGACRYTA